ncbi:MAG TPA: YtxH domain-containing protein [Anaerolineales bacterium]|nr:YtxH domain-containing protein [Anaerolineales bacterium]
MIHENQDYQYRANNTLGVVMGILVGGLVGAAAMLLLAPQSGKDTRMQIQKKGSELRDRTNELVEDTIAQVRSKANKLTVGLKDRSQEVAMKQLDHVSEAAQAGKKAIQSS